MPRPDKLPAAPTIPAPRFAMAWAALLYAVGTLLLSYPALGGRFLLNPVSDQFKAGYAFREFAASALRAGHGMPQWSPYLQGGMPYVGAMHGDIFYPTFLLRWLLPTDVAMTWEFMIHLFLCGLFTYAFLRAWSFDFPGSLVGGLAYMLGGSIAGYAYAGHDGKLFVSTMLPAALLLLTRGIRDGRSRSWGLLAIVIGLAVLSPHPQLLQYMLLVCGAFALYVALADHGNGALPRRVAATRLSLAAGAVAMGMLIGAVQFLPVFEYKPWSPRAGGHDWATATSYSFPIEETLNWYWPQFSGILERYWGRNGIHFHSDYFGAIVLLLAGAAFGATADSRRALRRFWIATGAVTLLWAFGGNTPFFHIVMALVPGTKYFRAPSTIIYVPAFAVAVLAALGTERIFARRVTTRYALGWVAGAGIFAILASVGYSAIAAAVVNSVASAMYPPELHAQAVDMLTSQRVAPNTVPAILGAWRSFAFVTLAAGVLWAFLGKRLDERRTIIALVVLMTIDLWSIERQYWVFSDPAAKLFASDKAIDAIRADMATHGPGRVFNAAMRPDANPLDRSLCVGLCQDAMRSGDLLMIHGLRVPGGYHGNELGLYQQLLAVDSGMAQLSPRFWHHENVQYWYTAADSALMARVSTQLNTAPFIRLAGPVTNAAGTTVYAYRMPMNNPAAWVTSAMIKAPPEQALSAIFDPRFNPGTVAIVDTSGRDITPAALTALPPAATLGARVTSYEPGDIQVQLDHASEAGQGLVVSENYFPGWQATAGNAQLRLARSNYNLIGVALPTGTTSVHLRFEDAAYAKGKFVTVVALLVALAAWGAGVLTDRRRLA